MTEHWVLVTASREWLDRQRMRASFLAVQEWLGEPAVAMGIVHGGARSGDRLADEIAAALGWARDPVPCTSEEWARYGQSAGMKRARRSPLLWAVTAVAQNSPEITSAIAIPLTDCSVRVRGRSS